MMMCLATKQSLEVKMQETCEHFSWELTAYINNLIETNPSANPVGNTTYLFVEKFSNSI